MNLAAKVQIAYSDQYFACSHNILANRLKSRFQASESPAVEWTSKILNTSTDLLEDYTYTDINVTSSSINQIAMAVKGLVFFLQAFIFNDKTAIQPFFDDIENW